MLASLDKYIYNNPPLIESNRTDGKSFENSKGKSILVIVKILLRQDNKMVIGRAR
jgi:hypothetical protein